MNSLFVNSTELLDLKCKIFNERAVIITNKNEKLIIYEKSIYNTRNRKIFTSRP